MAATRASWLRLAASAPWPRLLKGVDEGPRHKIEGFCQASLGEVRVILGDPGREHFAEERLAERAGPRRDSRATLRHQLSAALNASCFGEPFAGRVFGGQILLETQVQKPARPSPSIARMPASSRIRSRKPRASRPRPELGETSARPFAASSANSSNGAAVRSCC